MMKKFMASIALSASLCLGVPTPIMAMQTNAYKIQTIGQTTKKNATKVTLENGTGKKIKSIKLEKESNSKSTKNYLKKSLKNKAKVKLAYVVDKNEKYTLKVGIGDKTYEVKEFPFTDAKSVKLCLENDEMYIEYKSSESGDIVSTKKEKEEENTDTTDQTTTEDTTAQQDTQSANASATQQATTTQQAPAATQSQTQTQTTQAPASSGSSSSSSQTTTPSNGGCLDGALLN